LSIPNVPVYVVDHIVLGRLLNPWTIPTLELDDHQEDDDSDDESDMQATVESFYAKCGAVKKLSNSVRILYPAPAPSEWESEDVMTAALIRDRWSLLTADVSGSRLKAIDDRKVGWGKRVRCIRVKHLLCHLDFNGIRYERQLSSCVIPPFHPSGQMIIFLDPGLPCTFDIATELARILFPQTSRQAQSHRINTLLSTEPMRLAAQGYAVQHLLPSTRRVHASSSIRAAAAPAPVPAPLDAWQAGLEALAGIRRFAGSHIHGQAVGGQENMDLSCTRYLPMGEMRKLPETFGGLALFVAAEESKESASTLAQRAEDATALANILTALAVSVLGLREEDALGGLILFVEPHSSVVAFNREGTVWCNLSSYTQSRYSSGGQPVLTPTQVRCSWYLTLVHELAHNSQQAHGVEFESIMQSLTINTITPFIHHIQSLVQ
jgi:hypothetical protein